MATTAADLFNRALTLRTSGDFQSAARSYEAALRMEPRMAEAHLNLAYVLSELGRADEAVESYHSALRGRHWPADTAATANHNLGVLLHDMGRAAEATTSFERALAHKHDFGPSLAMIGSGGASGGGTRGDVDDDDDAVAEAIEAARTAGAANYVALINAGNEAFGRSAHAEAERHYRRAIPLRDARSDGAAYVGLGAALHSGRRLAEAKHVLQLGAKLNPSSPGMLQNLATVRSDLGEWKAAASAWRRALALTPRDAAGYGAAAATLQRGKRPADALPLMRQAASLEPTNWQLHYAHAHHSLKLAFGPVHAAAVAATSAAATDAAPAASATAAAPAASAARGTPDAALAAAALAALRPLHRPPISLRARAKSGIEPPWTRNNGRGLVGDQPPPLRAGASWQAQAGRRAEAAAAGRQSGVILYKLGPKASELDNLRLSLALLTRYHNRAFRYPILVAHDAEAAAALSDSLRAELAAVAEGAELGFEQLTKHAIPDWLPRHSVPEKVLGFPVAYRHMIRWKAGLMWRMASLQKYEFVWLIDTDAFLLGPLSYDVFGLMASRNATYGYVDVHSEDPSIVGGLSECVGRYLRARPSLDVASTVFSRFRTRQGKWDGSKFYTNFQVGRRSSAPRIASSQPALDAISRLTLLP